MATGAALTVGTGWAQQRGVSDSTAVAVTAALLLGLVGFVVGGIIFGY